MPSESMKAMKFLAGAQVGGAGVETGQYLDVKNVGVQVGIRGQADVFTPSNARIPSDVDNAADWTEAALDSRIFFDSLHLFLSSAFGAATITNITASQSWKWVWTVRADHAVPRVLLSYQWGSTSGHKKQSLDNFMNQFSFAVERLGAYAFTGRSIGQPWTTIGAFDTSPTPIAVSNNRALARKTGFYMSGTGASNTLANLATQMGTATTFGTPWSGKTFSAEFATGDMSNPKWVLNPLSSSWDDYIEADIAPTITTTVEGNATAMDEATTGSLMHTMRNGITKYVGLKTLGNTIGTSSDLYLFQIEAAAMLTVDSLDPGDTQGALSYPFRWTVVDDGSFALRLTLQNNRATLIT